MGWLIWSLETFPLLWPVLAYVAKTQVEFSMSVLVAKALETRSSRGCPSLLILGVLTPGLFPGIWILGSSEMS